MKTVVCGLGKCGSRMVLDLNAMIYGGSYSYKIKVSKDKRKRYGFLSDLFDNLFMQEAKAKFIPPDEVPKMHLGDSDNANEVVNYCTEPDVDNNVDQCRKDLQKGIIQFPNYHGACGQYHIVGEQVMLNLMRQNDTIRQTLLSNYIARNGIDNASCFILMFSAGGGTGCGTSTVLAEYVAEHAKSEYANLLVAGIAALPGEKESENYRDSAGRFLTKFLSSERATSFDTVITVGNSIMEDIDSDQNEVQSRANIFAANIILSLVNSSSKYNRSPINTDGPELRKNIKGLGYFCFAQQAKPQENKSINLDLVARALSPVSTRSLTGAETAKESLEGTSINFVHPKFFPREKWDDLVSIIHNLQDNIADIEKGDKKTLEKLLQEKFSDAKSQLPLAMRSCDNVVILRGIPSEQNSSSWEQTILVSLLEALFPKATIHYYSTYHGLPEHTLSLIPSGYMSYEIVSLITDYLFHVWETSQDRNSITRLLFNASGLDEQKAQQIFGEREVFDRKYSDFRDIYERTSGLFDLKEEDWNERFITVDNVVSMIRKVNSAIETAKRKPKVADEINWDDAEFDI